MSSLHSFLFVASPEYHTILRNFGDTFLMPLNIHTQNVYSGKASIYIGGALFLMSIITLLLSAYERIKSNRMLRQEEQTLNNIFAKITHELRTPLTVILGLSKQFKEDKNLTISNLTTYINAIERQGRNLSELVNQLLDMANLQRGEQTIEWKTGNIVAFVEMVYETFNIYAKQKEIELSFVSPEREIETDFVPDYLHKILYNLLSNAIKYSDEGTRIHLILERDKKESRKLLIRVIDHGKGIAPEVLPHIFDLFYKHPLTEKDLLTSSGIGLSLVKQLSEAMQGNVKVKSEIGKGSTFTVELPLRRDGKKIYGRWVPNKKAVQPLPPQEREPQVNGKHISSDLPDEEDPRTTILVVEDNKDVALFIRTLFNPDEYNVIHASNGEKAWEIANSRIPDIVITDVIMPKKNGITLCREMKESPLLNHIPIIMISARNGETDLLEGLKCGADSYIRKPFYPDELRVRVENLLAARQLLKEKYCRAAMKENSEEPADNVNSDFLRHATDIIYREMKNPDFTSGQLAQELAISVSQLNKKLNATTGYSSSTYILHVKIRHAKKILATQNKTIGEVAAECGIYDMNYFSRIFKKHTGITPTQYKRLPQS